MLLFEIHEDSTAEYSEGVSEETVGDTGSLCVQPENHLDEDVEESEFIYPDYLDEDLIPSKYTFITTALPGLKEKLDIDNEKILLDLTSVSKTFDLDYEDLTITDHPKDVESLLRSKL